MKTGQATRSWRLVDCEAVEYLKRKTCSKLPYNEESERWNSELVDRERDRESGKVGSKALIAHYWAHFMSHIADADGDADADAAAGTHAD